MNASSGVSRNQSEIPFNFPAVKDDSNTERLPGRQLLQFPRAGSFALFTGEVRLVLSATNGSRKHIAPWPTAFSQLSALE